MVSRDDLIYMAGIVDGEGCLRIMKHPNCNQLAQFLKDEIHTLNKKGGQR